MRQARRTWGAHLKQVLGGYPVLSLKIVCEGLEALDELSPDRFPLRFWVGDTLSNSPAFSRATRHLGLVQHH